MPHANLARHYDALTWDVDYRALAALADGALREAGMADGLVLDLACGTGTLSLLLAERGYEVIGADGSEEMLAVAHQKAMELTNGTPPIFLRQDMRKLDLYGTIDGCCCMLDSLNYLPTAEDLRTVLGRVRLFLNPGGVFVFDMLSPDYFSRMEGRSFVDETDEVFCVWRLAGMGGNAYEWTVDLFERAGKGWARRSESHREYAYPVAEIEKLIQEAGFVVRGLYGHPDRRPFDMGDDRLYVIAAAEESAGRKD